MAKYITPDPIQISCESCGCLYILYQTWKEPPVSQEISCEECGHVVWRNGGGRRHNSNTGQNYKISGEYKATIRKRAPHKDVVSADCDHDYQKEQIMGAHSGDWKCTKCGDIRGSRP